MSTLWTLLGVVLLLAGCIAPFGAPEAGRDGGDDANAEDADGTRSTPRVDFEPQPALVLEPSGVPENDTREDDEFWMVHVRGHEMREVKPGRSEVVCTILWDHDVDAPNRTVMHSSQYDFGDASHVRVLTAFDHFQRRTSCPIAYALHDGPYVEEEMGRYGPLSFRVHDDGSVELHGGTRVPLGQRAVVTYEDEVEDREGGTARVEGKFVVEPLGAWPQENLRRAE